MNVTPPISAAVSAQGPLAALPKNLSLADLLFADSPANAASDFRAIAASLFGAESPTTVQSPANSAISGKKPAAIVFEGKAEARKGKEISDPASATAAAELLVPSQTVPVSLIQYPAQLPAQTPTKLDASNKPQLNSGANDRTTRLDLGALPEQPQIKSTVNVAEVPEEHVLPAALSDQAQPLVQPATVDTLKSGKQLAAPVAVPATGASRKKDVEPAKSPADHSEPSPIPQNTKPPSPPVPTEDHTKQSTDSNSSGVNSSGFNSSGARSSGADGKPHVAITPVPTVPPLEVTPNPAPDKVVDNVVADRTIPQSVLAAPAAVAGSRSTSTRDSSNGPANINLPKNKDRSIKDLRTTPSPSGKPGFIPAGQPLTGSSFAGVEKDSPNFQLSGHSGAHSKPAPLKLSTDAPSSPASLMDADGPDETLPTSASSPVTAKLVQGMSQSEFRVGMQSQEFGNIDIRTSVVRHMFSAQISVEHSDVAKSLTAQLPGLYHRLADQQVAVGNIVIQGQGLGTSSNLAQDAQPKGSQPQGHTVAGIDGAAKSNAEPLLLMSTEGIDSAGRLDIRI